MIGAYSSLRVGQSEAIVRGADVPEEKTDPNKERRNNATSNQDCDYGAGEACVLTSFSPRHKSHSITPIMPSQPMNRTAPAI